MKKYITITAIILTMIFSFAACGTEKSLSQQDVTVSNINFTPPEGFIKKNDTWYSPNYKTDSSYINLTTTDKDKDFKKYTENTLKNSYTDAFKSQGVSLDVNIDKFEFITLDGFDAIRVQCSYQLENIKVVQIQYIIDADKTYVYTFANMGDANWLDAFDKSAEAITIEYSKN